MTSDPYSRDPRLKDFRNFLFLVWDYLGLPEPTKVQYEIADYLQNGPRRRIIEAFRGVGKSWITAAFVLWCLYWDPQLKIEVISASGKNAMDFTTFCLQLIEGMEELRFLAPRPDQRRSGERFDVGPASESKDPSVKSVGINGQITGTRADIIIPDDVETPRTSLTQNMRDRLSEAVKEFDAILKPGGRVIFLGTPQTEMSLYNVLPERGYDVRVWPVEYPTEKLLGIYGDRLAPVLRAELEADPSLTGKPTDPRRFNQQEVDERRLSYGQAGFALQFMLDTSLSDADRYPLRCRDFIVMDLDREMAPEKPVWASGAGQVLNGLPCVGLSGDGWFSPMELIGDWLPYTGSVLAIDPSGRGKDETAYAVVKFLNGYLYLTAWGGLRDGYGQETLEYLATVAKEHQVKAVVVESNYGDGMFTQLLSPVMRRIYPVGQIEEIRVSGTKELRILDIMEPVLAGHRLVVDKEVIREDYERVSGLPPDQRQRYMGFYQLTRMCREKGALLNDDRIDALSLAVHYWKDRMEKDADNAIEQRREELIAREMELCDDQGLWMELDKGSHFEPQRTWLDW